MCKTTDQIQKCLVCGLMSVLYSGRCPHCYHQTYGHDPTNPSGAEKDARIKELESHITLRELQKATYANAKAHGFHDGTGHIWKWLGNLHAEVSEAWEEARNPDCDPREIYYRADGKPEGVPAELADVVIRVADMAESIGFDLEAVVKAKMAYNETRPYRHGDKNA